LIFRRMNNQSLASVTKNRRRSSRHSLEQTVQQQGSMVTGLGLSIIERNPIHGIIGMTSLALDIDLTEEQREHLINVSQSVDCPWHIENAILDLAKIEAGRLELEQVPSRLSDIIGATMKLLQVRAKQKQLDVFWWSGF